MYVCVCVCAHARTHTHLFLYWSIGLAVREFANDPGDWGSIPGRVIPKTQKMVLDLSLLNTQHYKVWIKGKVEQSRERSSALPYTLVWWLLKRELLGSLHLWSPTIYIHVCKDLYTFIKYIYTCMNTP